MGAASGLASWPALSAWACCTCAVQQICKQVLQTLLGGASHAACSSWQHPVYVEPTPKHCRASISKGTAARLKEAEAQVEEVKNAARKQVAALELKLKASTSVQGCMAVRPEVCGGWSVGWMEMAGWLQD